jgi:exopolysaccharide biosynthesis polyprenyl glycosylphosphotransferase
MVEPLAFLGETVTIEAAPADSSSLENAGEGRLAVDPMARAAQSTVQGYRWKRSYRMRVLLVDMIAVVTAVLLASVGRFGLPHEENAQNHWMWVSVALYSVALATIWLTALGVQHSRDLTLVGVGAEEYRLVLISTFWVFGMIAAAGLVTREQMARGYLLIALPVGLVGLLIGRHLLRRHLATRRAQGQFLNHVLVLGTQAAVVSLCRSFDRSKGAGYKVVGACVLGFDGGRRYMLNTPTGDVPVLGDEDSVEAALRLSGADALAVAATESLGYERVRELLWCLDPLKVDMIVVPAMSDIAGPRLKVRPIDNLPLFHIARPRHDSSSSRSGKRLFDVAFSSLALLIAFPALVAIAIAIKLDDDGPVFFHQERPGLHGRRFRILKFRTMTHLPSNLNECIRAESPKSSRDIFFRKSESDNRVTRVGRFLRKTSLDELPQLFNVFAGSMSIVGPRPLLMGEGESVEHFLERRALVKPGITGLWQVSGRSDVTPEERVRLDYSYIDNWSCAQDMVIVLRTVRSVLKRQGAY